MPAEAALASSRVAMRTRRSTGRWRRVVGHAGALAVAAAALAACGAATSSAGPSPSPRDPGPVTAGPTDSPEPAPSPSVDGASFGVDRFPWPDTMVAARGLLAAMPNELGGEQREPMPVDAGGGEDELAVVAYGGERIAVLASDGSFGGGADAPPQDEGAQAKLAALFGLVYACDMDTYRGTIEPHPEYPGPGHSEPDRTTPAWFACRIMGAEGAEDFSAQAVGWTSADRIAWLAVAPDDATVQEVVTALQVAAR